MKAHSTPAGLRVLIMAGGTGGHVYPALAVAQKLLADGGEVVWMGVRQGLEADVVPRAGIELHFLCIAGLRGKGIVSWLVAPLKIARAVLEAMQAIRKIEPQVVLGMGGFASGPGGVAAWLLRKPLLIHEQNAVPGLTNRFLSLLARRVLESFPGSFAASRAPLHTGNPLRTEMLTVQPPEIRLAERRGPLRVLVLGGSLGAQALNDVVPRAIKQLPDSVAVEVRHQTGRLKLEATAELYKSLELNVMPCAYIDDMGEAYAWADLAVCRAGAMTIAELAAVGVPAVLVPFAKAADDHQTLNARFLAQAGAAVLLPEHQLEPHGLSALVTELSQTRSRLLKMACKACDCALPDATRDVCDMCVEVAHA